MTDILRTKLDNAIDLNDPDTWIALATEVAGQSIRNASEKLSELRSELATVTSQRDELSEAAKKARREHNAALLEVRNAEKVALQASFDGANYSEEIEPLQKTVVALEQKADGLAHASQAARNEWLPVRDRADELESDIASTIERIKALVGLPS